MKKSLILGVLMLSSVFAAQVGVEKANAWFPKPGMIEPPKLDLKEMPGILEQTRDFKIGRDDLNEPSLRLVFYKKTGRKDEAFVRMLHCADATPSMKSNLIGAVTDPIEEELKQKGFISSELASEHLSLVQKIYDGFKLCLPKAP